MDYYETHLNASNGCMDGWKKQEMNQPNQTSDLVPLEK